MRNEEDMTGGKVKEQMRKKRHGKEEAEKEEAQWQAIMRFLDQFEGNFKIHILLRTNKKLHKMRRRGQQVLPNFVVCLQT